MNENETTAPEGGDAPITTVSATEPAGAPAPTAESAPSPAPEAASSPPAAAKPDPYPKEGGAVMKDQNGDEVFVFAGSVHVDTKGKARDGVGEKLNEGWKIVDDRRAK